MVKKVKSRVNKVVAGMSAITGVVAWKVCQLLHTAYYDAIPTPLLMGIMCAILFGMLFMSVWLGSTATGSYDRSSILYEGPGSVIRYFIIGILVISILATLLEFLYELSPEHKEIEASSYVFILDESGSMNSNDPSGLRYKAISEIMREERNDLPYMVYTFSDNARIVRNMGPLETDYNEIPVTSDGGTSIFGTVIQVLNDYKDEVWNGGPTPKIIFLTDGAATDLSDGFLWFRGNMPEFDAALEEYSNLGINISTVGLGSVDREIMTKMADMTGGVFVSIQNASDLTAAMKTAATSYSDRNLLSIRYMRDYDAVYGILRILFLSIIGSAIGSLILFAYMEDTSIPILIVSSVISSVLGSVLLELGFKLGVSQRMLWCCLWILFSLTVGNIYPNRKENRILASLSGCNMAPLPYRLSEQKSPKSLLKLKR